MYANNSVVDVIRRNVLERGADASYEFLADAGGVDTKLSMLEIDRRARATAVSLLERAKPGARVMLLYPPGEHFVVGFVATLYAGMVAVPVYPPDPMRVARTLPRLRAVVQSSRAEIVLTDGLVKAFTAELFEQHAPEVARLPWIVTEEAMLEGADDWRMPAVAPDSVALLQYTSGSTGTPRGVVVTHGNLLSNGSAIAGAFGLADGDIVASWLPFYHDMGLLGGVLQPMLSGLSNVLMSPLEFMRRPMRWLEAISSRGATVSGGPNFAFDLCVNKSTPAERENLDLSSWRVAFCGAEPVRNRTLERFADAFAVSGFDRSALLPCYGLAEATLFVAGSGRGNGAHSIRVDRPALEQGRAEERADGDHLVASGLVADRHELAVVDPESGERVAPGTVGELWVRGSSVASGYWEDEAATEAAFGARLAGDPEPYLRTGDLGFVLDEQIFVTGRLKEMMVVRGRNLYAHDLEETAVAASPLARPGCGAAFSVETADGEQCVILHEVAASATEEDLPGIADAIAAAVQQEHGIALHDVVLLAARSLAKTSSGKIQRLTGRTAYTAGQVEGEIYRRSTTTAARGERRELTLPSRAELLPLTREERIDAIERALSLVGRGEGDAPATMVADLDLDSLAAVDLAFRIEEQTGVVTDPGLLLQPTSLRELAVALEERLESVAETPAEQPSGQRGGAVPLSAGQQSLLFMRDLEGPDCRQNVSVAVRLSEPVDAGVLAAAVRHIGTRHPILTAGFGVDGSRRVQIVDPAVPFELDVVDLTGETEQVLRARVDACALDPFDIEHGDVARAKLFTGCGAPVLVLAQHHAITDFWSVVTLLDELTTVYGDLLHERAPELPAAVGYEEFVRWQQDYERSPQWEADERYWLDLLAGDVQAPSLPAREEPRPDQGIASHRVTVDAELLAALERVAGESDTTVFSVLMAAFEVLIAAHSGARDFVVGATTAGRPQARFRNTLGYFANTIPVRAEPGAHPTVTELIRSTGQQLRRSLGHQHFPVSRLVELLRAQGNTSAAINTAVAFERPHNAIADDVTSVLFGAGSTGAVLGDLTLEPFPAGELATQFDITLHAIPTDGGLLAHLLVRADRFDEALAGQLGQQFLELLRQLVVRGGSPVSALQLTGATESLTRADVPARTLPDITSVHELFEATADRTPDATALVAGAEELTYAQVEAAANRLAHRLRQDGLRPEQTVGLCLERSPELIIAMLAVMKSGAAFVPLDPTLPQNRLADMVGDARCERILCHGATAGLAALLGEATRVDEESGADLPEDRPALAVTGDNLAYVIFTSGSTGRPKGVQIEHRSLVSYLLSFLDAFDVAEGDRVLQFAPLTFDPCLEEIFSAWTRGAALVLRDESVLGSPERFWAWCEKQRLTLVDIPTAFFHVLVTALESGVRVPPQLRSILIGGEAAHPDKLDQWFAADRAHVGLYNRWGTTETTVCSTIAHLGSESGRVSRARDVSIGADMTDAVVHVLDAELRPVADGVVGEAYIGGIGVGRGYASEPRKTAERFVPDPFATEPGRRLYATGDLVRRAADGELRYVGRADQQVKVRGYRIELGEVDVVLRRHPEVAEAAVVATRGAGETELIAAVTGVGVSTDGLRDWLNRELPSYMVPSRLLVLDAIPLTSNGKVDAHALRELALDVARSAGAADMSPLESRLAAVWCEVLEVAGVGPDEDFFALGGHSLRAADLNTRVRREFGVQPPLRMFFESVTVRAQAARIAELAAAEPVETVPATTVAAEVEPALSLGQRRLWFLEKFAPGSRAYVVPGVLRLYGELDRDVLRGALDAIVERHPALRTGFKDAGGRPVPFVHTGLTCPFEVLDRTSVAPARREAELSELVGEHVRQLFDLDTPPLMRAALVEFAPDEHALLLAFHHIVSDGRSMEIIAAELAELYAHGASTGAGEPPAVVHQYARWALDEGARLDSAEGRQGLDFWAGHLAGAPLALDLPFDRTRPAVQTFDGARVPLTLGQADSDLLRSLARDQQATVFMTLAACLSSTLSRLTGQERVVVGVPDANRPGDGAYDDVVGFFVNTVPLCFAAPGGATGRDLVARARATTLEAMPHKWVPFSAIVEASGQDRDPSRSPLFQVILDVRSGALPSPALPGLRVETAPLYTGTAKTDLTFEITDDGGPLTGWLEFNTDLFRPETAQLVARLFAETARAMAQRPDERVETPSAAAALRHWPAPAGAEQHPDTFWAQFERAVDSRPDAIALEGADSALTYGELHTRVEQVARVIADRFAVRPGDVVAVSVEPSVEAVVAVLAAQRSGAAYLPIDPAYPAERKVFMLADSGARGLVTRELVEEAMRAAPAEAVALPQADPDAPAYLLYTSGSTGRPKGVLVSHRSLANLTAAQAGVFGIDAGSRMLQFASLSFDASVWEIFSTLAAGGTLCVVGREHALVGEALADVLAERAISVCLLPPSVIASLPVRALPLLKTLVSGGEACRAELVERWQPGRRFVNAYGPTECTVAITAAVLEPGQPASLGAVLPGGTAYVLDADLRPVVAGAVGELYAGGAGLALGYHGRPALTAGHFLPDPFSAVPGARMYRTGDLVRLRADGTLDYCGRSDSQIKLRGYRVEPAEIESVLLALAGVTQAVVRGLDGVLVAHVETADPELTPQALGKLCAAQLPPHMVPAAFVARTELPRLPGGKIDPSRLDRPRRADFAHADFAEPETETERTVARVWARVLDVDAVGAGDDFFTIGGHSLLATVITSQVGEELGREVPLRALFEAPVLRDYAALCDAAGVRDTSGGIAALAADGGDAPVSVMQERLWLLEEIENGSGHNALTGRYHLAGAIRLTGALDEAALQRAVDRLVDRHTTLRTVVTHRDGVLTQSVLDSADVTLTRTALTGVTAEERVSEALALVEREAAQPMDLSAGPLLRVRLLDLGRDDAVLVLTLHHIVGDGWSMEILKRDLTHFYAEEAGHEPAAPLPPLPVTYEQFSRWQRRQLDSGALDASVAYWCEQLDALPSLTLPIARSGSAPADDEQSHRVRATVTPELREAMERLAAGSGATLFMVLAATLQLTLGRLAGQRDFAIGVPIAGRRHREVEDLIGFFINSLVLRADLSGDPTFAELLDRVRTTTLDAYEHQDVPFETLVGKLAPERDLNTTPLFQVYLNLLNIPPHQSGLPGIEVDTFAVPNLGAKFELTFYVDPAGPGLSLDLMYAGERFDEATTRELLAQWIRVIEQAVTDSDSPIDALRLDTPQARRELPDPAAPLDTTWYGSVVEQFERLAAREPQRIAISEPGQELTYGDLAWATAAMSGLLNQQGVAKGDVVAVYGERSASLVWAILSVMRAGASFAILDPSYPADRIADCLAVARPSAFLQLEGAGAVPLAVDTALQAHSLRCRFELPSRLADARHLVPQGAEPAEAVQVGPRDCAYIAFTSGSTGKPKGIRGAHGSLTHFVPWMVETFGLRETDRYSLLSGISHDPLHREVFTPLVTGATICVPDRLDVETPGRLAQWFRTAQVSVSHMTPPTARLFDQLSVAPGTLPLLERVFFLGDTLTSRDVRAVTRMAGSATCVNLYGSTETQRAVGYHVVPAAHGTADTDPGVTYPLGRGMKDVQLLVLNEAGQQAGVGEPGEIVIRSPHLSLGYADEQLNAAKFVRNPFGTSDDDRMYRTGDLGRYLADGSVTPLGRADNQVKIRGYRVETDEVQHVICSAPEVQDALVTARPDASGETALVAYVVARPGQKVAGNELKGYVRKRLPDYMVPAFVVVLDAFPLTPNRKIDRAALPAPSAAAGVHEEGPRTPLTPTEELVAGLWQDVLGAHQVGPEDNFFNLGGHSLMATQVVSRIRRVFGCEIALRTLFEKQTVRDLAAHIDGVAGGTAVSEPIVALPRTGTLPASYGQERLWVLDQLEGDTGAYNSPTVVRMRGPLDTEAMAATLDELVARHEVLRTRIVMDDGRVGQIVEPAGEVTLPLTVVDLSEEPQQDAEQRMWQLVDEAARHRFDLAQAPLEQATLIRLSDEDHVFVLTVHHVVADGWGLQIVVRDFAALYQARRQGTASPLPDLEVQYADWSSWQRDRVEGGDYQGQLDFWCETLADPASVLEFPAQRPRPAVMTNRGLTVRRILDAELVNGVRHVGREHNATLFMTLLAAFNAQLHRYSGAADIAVATPVGTRSVEIEDVVGFFVNTIVFRNKLAGEESFTELLERVRATTLAAYANQDVPFDRVVDALQPHRDLSVSPLFQVMFTLHNAPYSEIDLGDLRLERLHAPAGTAKFDLSLDLAEEKDGLHATLELNADLFDAETGEQLLDHFEALLGSITAAPTAAVADLEIRSAAEAAAQDALSAGPAALTPRSTAEALEHWARHTPDAPAVVDGTTVWTYRELRDRVAALAGRLTEAATGPEPAVVVCAERSARYIAAALACGAAGATYVPVSPAVPDRRIATILDRLGEVVAVTDDEQADRIAALLGDSRARGSHLVLDDSATADRPLAAAGAHPSRRAYVIFTSGTTGEPKGVEIEQAGLLGHLELMAHDLELSSGDVVAQTASQSFDISVWQMLVAVMRGATTVVSSAATSRDAEALLALVRERGVTVLQLVPGMIRALLDHAADDDLASLRFLIATGEALPPDLAADWLRRFPGIPMVNAYGPAECSDDTHLAVLSTPPQQDRPVPLGSPVAGVTSYVLDAQGRRVPFGVPGELAIGGPVVGRGYLGDPKATADRFVPDPYTTVPGARLYRTGDRVRLHADGRLEFLGRLDDQLKIRGFRIEAGEVETALCELPAVREAAVVLRDCDGEPTLVACVVGTEHDPAVLAAALGTRLPRYMVPTGYVFADRLPRNANGKVDRAALQREDVTVERVRQRFEALSGPTERLVASVFEELLGTPAVGALDDFFTLGGHSLLATRLVAELAAQTDIELPLRTVFEQPTVRGVAEALEQLQMAGLSEAELLELEVLLDGVTDDQARELLAAGEERDA